MPKREPPLSSLRVFEAAARRLSFAQAADELAVTPGAVSRQIQGLERELGTELFRRGNRKVELTPAGRAYAEEVRAALDRISSATARVRGAARGPLAICAYPTFAMRWLMPRWRQFHDRHPEIDVQLTTSLAPVEFNRDGFDAAVRMGEGNWPGLGAIKLADVESFPVCSPQLFKGRKPDLARVRLIHSAPRPQDWPRWLAAAKVTGVDASQGPSFESLNLAFQAAIEGIGVAIGIGCLVADDLAQRRLVRPFKPVRRSRRGFWLVYPQARAGDPRLAAFLAWLHDLGDR